MADVVNKFQGAERFTKLDLKEAYHQFVLDIPSREITTFYCPDGLYRYKRVNYGTKSAQDTLQLEMQKMLSDIPNQVNIADDILIGGSVEEHDAALEQVLSAMASNGVNSEPSEMRTGCRRSKFRWNSLQQEWNQTRPEEREESAGRHSPNQ